MSFAALKENGSVVTWGNSHTEYSSSVSDKLNNTEDVETKIFTTNGSAFAVIIVNE